MMGSYSRFLLALTVCAACGKVTDNKNGGLPDAAGITDASSGTDAAVAGQVTVTVLDPSNTGALAVGANVVFINPDGSLVAKVATDNNGQAHADVLPGASATSIVVDGTEYEMQTVLAVKPGDNITLGSKDDDDTSSTFTVTIPTLITASSYQLSGPCGGGSTAQPATGAPPAPITLTIYNYCKQATMDLVVIALDANSKPLSSVEKKDVAFTPGGMTTIAGSYTAVQNFTASYTNINPIITDLETNRYVPDPAGQETEGDVSTSGATAALTLAGSAVTTTAQVETIVRQSAASFQQIRKSIPGSTSTYGLDIGATLLPWISTPTFDATSEKLTVPTVTTGTTTDKPDMFIIGAAYTRTDPTTMASTSYVWIVTGPEIGDINLPKLPDDLAALMPTSTDTVRILLAAAFEAANVDGNDGTRNNPIAMYDQYILKSANSDVRVVRYQARN